MNLVERAYAYSIKVPREKRGNYERKTRYTQSYLPYLKDMDKRLDLPEQKDLVVLHPFIYKLRSITNEKDKRLSFVVNYKA